MARVAMTDCVVPPDGLLKTIDPPLPALSVTLPADQDPVANARICAPASSVINGADSEILPELPVEGTSMLVASDPEATVRLTKYPVEVMVMLSLAVRTIFAPSELMLVLAPLGPSIVRAAGSNTTVP